MFWFGIDCSVPNAFAYVEIKPIVGILSFTHFFKHTAISLNKTVGATKKAAPLSVQY